MQSLLALPSVLYATLGLAGHVTGRRRSRQVRIKCSTYFISYTLASIVATGFSVTVKFPQCRVPPLGGFHLSCHGPHGAGNAECGHWQFILILLGPQNAYSMPPLKLICSKSPRAHHLKLLFLKSAPLKITLLREYST